METGRKRKYSKNKKKNWRKHTDIKDVEKFLESRSREQVTGTPAAEKSNQQLFFVQKEVGREDGVSSSRKLKKPLISELRLTPSSAVPGFPPRKRRRKEQHNEMDFSVNQSDPQVDSSSDEDEYSKSVSYQTLNSQQNEKLLNKMDAKPPQSSVLLVQGDLWNVVTDTHSGIHDEHFQRVTKKKAIKRPLTLRSKPSALSSIEIPHPGMSYNPTYEDHQELLRMAVSVEEERVKAIEKLEKKLQLAKLTHTQREQVWLDEMKFHSHSDGCQSSDDERDEVVMKRPVRAENRKTKKQKRKEGERKEEKKKRAQEKAAKIKRDEFYRLRTIKKEIAEKERCALEKEQVRLETEATAPYQTHRLGKQQYEEADIDVQLSTEINQSLRKLKPEGNLAIDRFKSLQKRNIIEPRNVVRRRRKYKLRVKEKRSCKLPEELPT